MYICICKAVTVDEVEEVVESGFHEFHEVQARSKACTDCGTCRFKLQRLISDKVSQKSPANPKKSAS